MSKTIVVNKPGLIVAATLATTVLTGASADVLSGGLESSYLPIVRWSGDISFTANPDDTGALGVINSLSFTQAFGTALFGLASLFWQFAILVLGIADSIGDVSSWGRTVDHSLKSVLQTFVDGPGQGMSPIGIFVIVALLATIISGLVRIRKQGGMAILKRIAAVVIIGGIFWFSSHQVLDTNTNGAGKTGKYEPSVGTPGWVAVSFAKGIDFAAGALVNPVTTSVTTPRGDGDDQSRLGCDAVLGTMNELYQDSDGSASSRAISSIWEMQALPAYIGMQFGSANTIGADVFCRQLDYVSVDVDASMMYAIDMEIKNADNDSGLYKGTGVGPGYVAYNTLTEKQWNYTMLAWAACDYNDDGNWVVDPMFEGLWSNPDGSESDKTLRDEHCATWSNLETLNSSAEDEGFPEQFVWHRGNVNEMVAGISADDQHRAEEVRDFLRVYAGDMRIGNAWAYVATTSVSATIVGGVGLISLIAKIVTMFFLVSVWFLMVVALFRQRPMSDVLGPSLMRLLGATLVSYGSALLLSMIVMFSVIIISLLTFGSYRYNMWGTWIAGVAPVISVIAIHLFFKNVLKMPSPLTFKGMSAWQKGAPFAAGALAGGVAGAGGALLAGRADRMGSNAVRSGMRTMGRALANKVTGGEMGAAQSSGRGLDGGARSAAQLAAMQEPKEAAASGINLLGGRDKEGSLLTGKDGKVLSERKARKEGLRQEQQRLRDAGHLKDAAFVRQQARAGRQQLSGARGDLAGHKAKLRALQRGTGGYAHLGSNERRKMMVQERNAIRAGQESLRSMKADHKKRMRQVRIDAGRTRSWHIGENLEAARQQTAKALGDKPETMKSKVATAARTARNMTAGATDEQRQRRANTARRSAAAGMMVASLGTAAPIAAGMMAPDIVAAAKRKPTVAATQLANALGSEQKSAEAEERRVAAEKVVQGEVAESNVSRAEEAGAQRRGEGGAE